MRDRVKPFAYVLTASFSGDAEFFLVVTPSRLTAYLAVSVDLSCVFASGVGSGLPCRVCASRDYSRCGSFESACVQVDGQAVRVCRV